MYELIRVSDNACQAVGGFDSLLPLCRRYSVPMIIRDYYTKEIVLRQFGRRHHHNCIL